MVAQPALLPEGETSHGSHGWWWSDRMLLGGNLQGEISGREWSGVVLTSRTDESYMVHMGGGGGRASPGIGHQ